jgi:hypothetical protein
LGIKDISFSYLSETYVFQTSDEGANDLDAGQSGAHFLRSAHYSL